MTSARHLHTRWNFAVIVADASVYMAGLAFVDPTVVLPVLVGHLTPSKVILGLFGTLQRAGWLLPQLLGASFVLHRAHRKPYVLYPCLATRVPFYVLAAVMLTPWAKHHPQGLLLLLMLSWAIFFFGDGFSSVPWHDIIARTIPTTTRGRFFGAMQSLGALLAIGSAAVVNRVLSPNGPPFPYNFGLLFSYFCVGLTLSSIFLSLIREPPSRDLAEAQSSLSMFRGIPHTLRAHPDFARLLLALNFCGLASLALPFYAKYAYDRLGLPDATSGLFIAAGVAGAVAGGFVWAYLCDRIGSTRVIRGVAWLEVAMPITALAAPALTAAVGIRGALPYLYSVVFFCSSATAGGLWMGFTTHVMEIAPPEQRPIFLGLQSFLSLPTVCMPVLGGLLLNLIPYQALFAVVAITGVLAALYVHTLPEPRHSACAAELIR